MRRRSSGRAANSARLDAGRLRVEAPAPGILRLRWDAAARFAEPLSGLPVALDAAAQPAAPRRAAGALRLDTEGLSLSVDTRTLALAVDDGRGQRLFGAKRPGARAEGMPRPTLFHEPAPEDWPPERGGARLAFTVDPAARFYGLGEKAGPLDKAGRRWEFWNTDAYRHTPAADPLYKSIPALLAAIPTPHGLAWFGMVFDNPSRCQLDLGLRARGRCEYLAGHGCLDLWVLAGPSPAAVLGRLAQVAGAPHLPPLWALGWHQSRWGYRSAAEALEAARRHRALGLPLDALHLDIDHMDGYRVFTWDRRRFGPPKALAAALRGMGVRAVAITDPGLKAEAGYDVYAQMRREGCLVRDRRGREVRARVWPGDSAFPDFFNPAARDAWAGLQARLKAQGIDGAWCDMNEPACFGHATLPGAVHRTAQGRLPHAAVRNLYGGLMAQAAAEGLHKADPGHRPFVLSRAAYLGIQRHAAVWLGDNTSSFEYLSLGVAMLLGMGLSGVPFCGVDIGGFDRDCDPELLARWVQVGALMPFARNHNTALARPQEPWAFGEPALSICRRWMSLRYRLMPYLMTLFERAGRRGEPVMRPLLYEYPQDVDALAVQDQFMLGPWLMAAPVMTAGARARAVWLPQGVWTERASGRRLSGGRWVLADAPLDTMPLYVRRGAIVPGWEPALSTASADRTRLLLDLYPEPGLTRSFTLYDDDGETTAHERGDSLRWTFTLSCDARGRWARLDIARPEGRRANPYRRVVLRFHGLQGRPHAVTVDGKAWAFGRQAGEGVVHGLAAGHTQARLEVEAACQSVALDGLPGIVKPD